jgi:hypothetical protein
LGHREDGLHNAEDNAALPRYGPVQRPAQHHQRPGDSTPTRRSWQRVGSTYRFLAVVRLRSLSLPQKRVPSRGHEAEHPLSDHQYRDQLRGPPHAHSSSTSRGSLLVSAQLRHAPRHEYRAMSVAYYRIGDAAQKRPPKATEVSASHHYTPDSVFSGSRSESIDSGAPTNRSQAKRAPIGPGGRARRRGKRRHLYGDPSAERR